MRRGSCRHNESEDPLVERIRARTQRAHRAEFREAVVLDGVAFVPGLLIPVWAVWMLALFLSTAAQIAIEEWRKLCSLISRRPKV